MNWIKKGRELRGKSQQELAEMLMIPIDIVQSFEAEETEPNWGMMEKIRNTFKAWDK